MLNEKKSGQNTPDRKAEKANSGRIAEHRATEGKDGKNAKAVPAVRRSVREMVIENEKRFAATMKSLGE